MSEHAIAQPQKTNVPQQITSNAVNFQRQAINHDKTAVLSEWKHDTVSDDFAEPRFGYDFSRVPAHTDMVQQTQPLLRTRTMVQRSPGNGTASSAPCVTCSDEESTPISAPAEPTAEPTSPTPESTPTLTTTEPEAESAAQGETTAPTLLVEDSATVIAPEQMRKSDFLAQLQTEVAFTAQAAMAGTGRTTADCPYLNYWFGYYSLRDGAHIERAIHRYAPETRSATSPREYISIITGRVRRSVETWVRTGEITGVPEGIPANLPGEATAQSGGGEETSSGSVMFKAREGGARATENPQAIQAELGQGRPLESNVRSRMGSAFGMDFAHVRTHTDSTAVTLSNRLNARAFTVGRDIAFGSGEYQPGTIIGDALIAHELAHVVQQRGTAAALAPAQTGDASHDMLENDADKSAMVAVVSLWNGAKGIFADIAQKTVPSLRSGLRLSRCKDESKQKATVQVRSSGNKSSGNNKKFPAGYGGDKLGPLTDEDDGITIAEGTGKIEIAATLPPKPASAGWDIKRRIIFKDFSNGSLSDSSSGRDDTSDPAFKDLVPDADRKIYDIDGPTVGVGLAVNHTKETYNNFTQCVELNNSRVSDDAKWHYRAKVDDDLDAANKPKNDDTELNDVGTGHITIPSKAHYNIR